MALYAVISLVLAIFGATHVSINGIKTHWQARFSGAVSDAKTTANKIRQNVPEGKNDWKRCAECEKSVDFFDKGWSLLAVIPTVIFTIVVFAIASASFSYWDDVPNGFAGAHPARWIACRWCVGGFTLINFICLAGLLFCGWRVRSHRVKLEALDESTSQMKAYLLEAVKKDNPVAGSTVSQKL